MTPSIKPQLQSSDMEQELCDNYGRQCELLTPWRGYHRGTIVGMNGYRYIVQFSSGAEIEVYEDEIEFD